MPGLEFWVVLEKHPAYSEEGHLIFSSMLSKLILEIYIKPQLGSVSSQMLKEPKSGYQLVLSIMAKRLHELNLIC